MKRYLTYLSLFSLCSIAMSQHSTHKDWIAQHNLQPHIQPQTLLVSQPIDEIIGNAPKEAYTSYYDSMSTLAIIMVCLVALLVISILVWYFVIRKMRYPTFKVDHFAVTRPYRSKKNIRGAYRVVCSASPIKQSKWERIYKGKMVNEVNNNWTTPVIFEPHVEDGEHGAKHHDNKHYIVTATTHKKDHPSTLTNKVTLVSIEVKLM